MFEVKVQEERSHLHTVSIGDVSEIVLFYGVSVVLAALIFLVEIIVSNVKTEHQEDRRNFIS